MPCGAHSIGGRFLVQCLRLGEEVVGRNFLTSTLLLRLVCFVGRLNQVTNLCWPRIWLGLFQDKKRF